MLKDLPVILSLPSWYLAKQSVFVPPSGISRGGNLCCSVPLLYFFPCVSTTQAMRVFVPSSFFQSDGPSPLPSFSRGGGGGGGGGPFSCVGEKKRRKRLVSQIPSATRRRRGRRFKHCCDICSWREGKPLSLVKSSSDPFPSLNHASPDPLPPSSPPHSQGDTMQRDGGRKCEGGGEKGDS